MSTLTYRCLGGSGGNKIAKAVFTYNKKRKSFLIRMWMVVVLYL